MSEAERLSAELRKLSADMTQGDPVTAAMLVRAAIFISDVTTALDNAKKMRDTYREWADARAKEADENAAYAELTTRALKAVVEESARCPLDVSDADAILARIREAADTALAKSESEIGPQCNPTLTECPRCKNDISKCDGTFVGIQSAKAEERHAVGTFPKKIYLQPGEGNQGETTWCADKIHDDDIEYVRADTVHSQVHPQPGAWRQCNRCAWTFDTSKGVGPLWCPECNSYDTRSVSAPQTSPATCNPQEADRG